MQRFPIFFEMRISENYYKPLKSFIYASTLNYLINTTVSKNLEVLQKFTSK